MLWDNSTRNRALTTTSAGRAEKTLGKQMVGNGECKDHGGLHSPDPAKKNQHRSAKKGVGEENLKEKKKEVKNSDQKN